MTGPLPFSVDSLRYTAYTYFMMSGPGQAALGHVGGQGLALIPPMAPSVCAGCGRNPARGDPHPYLCPVLVRLCAQLVAAGDPGRTRWRAECLRLSRAAAGGRWSREAEHWRRVWAEPEPPDALLTPGLVPDGDGMREDPDAGRPGCDVPAALRDWLDRNSPGWVPVPPAFGTIDYPPSGTDPAADSPSSEPYP